MVIRAFPMSFADANVQESNALAVGITYHGRLYLWDHVIQLIIPKASVRLVRDVWFAGLDLLALGVRQAKLDQLAPEVL